MRGTFRELANAGEILNHIPPLSPHPRRDARCRWRHVISAAAPTGLDKAAPCKRSDGDAGRSRDEVDPVCETAGAAS
jgi:hypothetical protein